MTQRNGGTWNRRAIPSVDVDVEVSNVEVSKIEMR